MMPGNELPDDRLLRPVRHHGADLRVGDDESPAPPAPPALHARIARPVRADGPDVGRLHRRWRLRRRGGGWGGGGGVVERRWERWWGQRPPGGGRAGPP